jgi:hypothetical protein
MFGLPIEVILSLVTGIGGFMMKMQAQRQADFVNLIKLGMEKNQQSSDLADAAAKRSNPFLRKTIAWFVIAIVFGGILLVAFQPDIPVSIVEPKAQKELLWGLFKWGKTMEVTVAQGLVFPEWVKYTIITIISFLFGTGAAKIQK